MEIPHEDQSSHYDHEKDKFAYLSMRDRIELGKRQVQQSQWGSKYALNGDDSYEHTVGECPTIPTMRDMYGYQSSYTSSWNNYPNLATQPQPQSSMSTSSLEQAILKISKVMEDFKSVDDRHFGGDCYDKSMDQPSIENHKVQNDKGLPESFKESTSPGREEKANSLDQMGRMPILFGIQGEFSMKWESIASNGARFGVETKKLWSLQANCTELTENFAHHCSRCENFRTVRNTLLAHECHFAHLKPLFAPCETRCESRCHFAHHYSRCEIHSNVFVNNYAKLNGNVAAAPNFTTVRHVFGAVPGEVRNPLLQTVHDLDLKRRSYGRLKTDYTNPVHLGITHQASHSISYLLKPSKLIAPTESSS
ncbi:hypothetical protein AAG906_015006 [Vitis piasezkii]